MNRIINYGYCVRFMPWLRTFAFIGSIVFAPVFALWSAHAQEAQGSVEGTVYSIINNAPIARARVVIKETGWESITDDYGRYSFLRVAPGDYQINVTYLGFASQAASTKVTGGMSAVLDFRLDREGMSRQSAGQGEDSGVVMLERYTVVADQTMTAQAIAMNEQRHAANIKNVVAFEELGEQGQENIGAYMRFMPGVVIMEGAGDSPGTIGLGGFPAEMSTVQLDGGDIAGTGVGATSTRTLALQDIPMVNIERIEVSKVPTSDHGCPVISSTTATG